MRVFVAQPREQIAALELLFQHLPGPDAHARTSAAQKLLHDSSACLLVARDDDSIIGATLIQVLPGATGVIWPPSANGKPKIETALLGEALKLMREQGAKIAQAILAPSEKHLAAPLLHGAFARTTQLCYLRLDPRQNSIPFAHGEYENYRADRAAEFHNVLLRTYRGTLDFPELDGLRNLDEILQGYQSAGFDPSRWFLLRDETGVLILAESEPGEVWEISYVGVVPEARRRGIGRNLVRKAIAETITNRVPRLMVAVDARNVPAMKLYREEGFVEFDRRDVFLKPLGEPEA